jgi:hypothetical protein
MPRNIPTALDPLLAKQTTAVGYLVRIVFPTVTTLYLCDIGTVTSGGQVFQDYDVRVTGVGSESVGVQIENTDNAIGAYVLTTNFLSNVDIAIWQFERDNPDASVLLGQYNPTKADVGIDSVKLTCRRMKVAARFAPKRRINEREGLRFALQNGEFLFSGKRIVIKERD